MKKLKILLAVISVVISIHVQAQYAEFGYQVSFPVSDFKEFVSKTSFAGVSVGYRMALRKNPQLSIGGIFNWYYLSDKKGSITTPTADGGAYTGNTTRFTNIYSLLAVIQYDFSDNSQNFVPFIKCGFGADYQSQRTDIGLYAFKNDGVQFAAHTEFGIRLNKDRVNGLFIAATYDMMPAAANLVSTSLFGLKIGYSRFNLH